MITSQQATPAIAPRGPAGGGQEAKDAKCHALCASSRDVLKIMGGRHERSASQHKRKTHVTAGEGRGRAVTNQRTQGNSLTASGAVRGTLS